MMRLSEMQKEFWRNANHRWNIKQGATRSGKTYLDYFMIPRRIRACTGNGLIVLLGNTSGTINRNILEPMRNIYGDRLVGMPQSGNNTVKLFGKKCFVLGADKINQVSKIQGAGIEYCYGDEITTWNEEMFAMLKSRLDKENSKFDGTCNPDNPNHWFKKFLDSDADIYSQSYTIDDNPFLTKSFVDNLKKEYAGTVYYDRFILGKWKPAEGIIYTLFADNPDLFTIDSINPEDIAFAAIGVDFGGNKSAHAFVCNGFTKGLKEVVTLDEFYIKEKISPSQLEDYFVAFVRQCRAKYRVYEAYCDSAETTLIQGLEAAAAKHNLGIDVRLATKKRITDRIRFYNALMSHERYKILKHCVHVSEALQSAVWDDKSAEDKRLDDGKMNVDSLDALEYSTEYYMNDIISLAVR